MVSSSRSLASYLKISLATVQIRAFSDYFLKNKKSTQNAAFLAFIVGFPLVAYETFKKKVVAKSDQDTDSQKSFLVNGILSVKKLGCIMFADHPVPWRDCSEVERRNQVSSRSQQFFKDPNDDESIFVQLVRSCLATGRFFLADDGRDVPKEKGEEKRKEKSYPKTIQLHSAKCAIMSKKGDKYCTVREDTKKEICIDLSTPQVSDYAKIFSNTASADDEKKHRITFKDRKIIEYENRLRCYSSPDKLFRYFATLESYLDHYSQQTHQHQDHHKHLDYHRPGTKTKIYMNAEDFVRSISPGSMQPEGLGLDSFRSFDPANSKIICNLDADSIFYKINRDGLLDFIDYMFILMVLTHPVRHFRMAFHLFDSTGEGYINIEDFKRIEHVMLTQTKMGNDHRDTGHMSLKNGVIHEKETTSLLARHFFGPDLKGQMAIEDFLTFQQEIKREVGSIEFDAYGPDERDCILPEDFVDSMLKHFNGSTQQKKKVKKMRNNIRKAYTAGEDEEPDTTRISRQEFLDFNTFMSYPILMKMAFENYHQAGVKITRRVFKHIARQIAGVNLSERLIDMVYIMLDSYEQDDLDEKRFSQLVKTRTTYGLKASIDTLSTTVFLKSAARCMGRQFQAFLRYLKLDYVDASKIRGTRHGVGFHQFNHQLGRCGCRFCGRKSD